MKKLITLLLLTTIVQAQNRTGYAAIIVGADTKNLILGSNATNNAPELNILYKLVMGSNNFELTASYERFEAISFDKIALGVGYHINYKNITLIPSIESCLISRWVNDNKIDAFSVSLNTSLRYFFTKRIGVEIIFNALPRSDLKKMYPSIHKTTPIILSTYTCLIYKLN